MPKGYAGKLLFVDLSSGTTREEEVTDELARNFLGGYGFGAKVVYNGQPAGVDPLGPENMVGFTTGPLTATRTPFSGRYTVVGKSPLTGTWGDANSGGHFGPAMKRAGYDCVFFTGISEKPVYLLLRDRKAELRDASALWGKDSVETEEMLRNQLGDAKAELTCIGQAGERKALISCPINNRGRAPGRSGFGAAMGSKRLKAVVAQATGRINVADSTTLNELSKAGAKEARKTMAEFAKYGTTRGTGDSIRSGDCPVKNWAGVGSEEFEDPDAVGGDNVIRYQVRRYFCAQCPVGCGGTMKVSEGPYAIENAHKPEYETLGAYGGMVMNNNVESIIWCNDLCNRYGLDTISAGAVVAFAIECYENGLLTKEDTDGLELTWGDHEAIVALTEKIGLREGIGDLLADGVKVASEKIGKGSEEFAVHVHGQELPMHDPRLSQARKAQLPMLGIIYESDATPGRHTAASDPRGHSYTSAGLCLMGGRLFRGENLPKYLTAATGIEFTEDTVEEVGERIMIMRQAFNLREGVTKKDLHLPPRAQGVPPHKSGPLADVTLDMATATREYLSGMGWDPEIGKPPKERVVELGGLDEVVKDLY